GGTLKLGGALTLTNGSVLGAINGTVEYNGTGAQTVNTTFSYGNLIISGARGANSVTIGAATVQVFGTFTPSATFTTGVYNVTSGNTFIFSGSSPQVIPSAAALTYNNITVNGSGTATLNANISLNGNINVFSPGVMDLSTFTVNRTTLGGTLMVGS